MIDRTHALPVTRQAREMGISRGSVYYLPRPTSDADLAIMRRIDELHGLPVRWEPDVARPACCRRRQGWPPACFDADEEDGDRGDLPAAEHVEAGATCEAWLCHDGHKVYPYLLSRLAVTRPNQVWATDITYIPMARGFVYLIAIVDWFSRRVLVWRLSITLETDFCIETLEEALTRFGAPEIFNIDQGSQFTCMDGRGAWRDNVFVERLWRSVKDEDVYLRTYGSVSDARVLLGRYLAFYNGRRPHSSLDRKIPDNVYFNQPLLAAA